MLSSKTLKIIKIIKLIISIVIYIFIIYYTFWAYLCSDLAIGVWGGVDEDVLAAGIALGYFSIILSVVFYSLNFRKKTALVLTNLAVATNVYSLIKLDEIAALLPPHLR